MHPGLGGRHSEDSQEGCETYCLPSPMADPIREPPADEMRRLRVRDAPRGRSDFVNTHDQRLADTSAPYRDRSHERVPDVERRISGDELVLRLDVPRGVRHREAHPVAWLDGQHRFEIARKIPVERFVAER